MLYLDKQGTQRDVSLFMYSKSLRSRFSNRVSGILWQRLKINYRALYSWNLPVMLEVKKHIAFEIVSRCFLRPAGAVLFICGFLGLCNLARGIWV